MFKDYDITATGVVHGAPTIVTVQVRARNPRDARLAAMRLCKFPIFDTRPVFRTVAVIDMVGS